MNDLPTGAEQATPFRVLTAAAVFAVAWLAWSGVYTPLILAFGALSTALVTLLAVRTGFFSADAYALDLSPGLPRYWAWLLTEIATWNLRVARIVISPRLAIEPVLVSIDARGLPPAALATLANSITLTPGTISIDVQNGWIEVHCLTTEAADGLCSGEMLERVRGLAET